MDIKRIYIAIIILAVLAACTWAGKSTDSLLVTGGANLNRVYIGSVTGSSGARLNIDTVRTKYLSADSCLQLPERTNDCNSDGAIWYQENHGSIHSYIDGLVGTLNRTLFVQSNTVLDSNSTVETSLIGASVNHVFDSFPVDYFQLGKTHHFVMQGVYSTKTTVPGNLIIRVKLNSTVLCSTIVALDANETDQAWKIDGYNVCVDTGNTGKFRLNTGFEHSIAGILHEDKITTPNGGVTINTNSKLKPDITFKFGTADVSNKIKSTQFIIEELH